MAPLMTVRRSGTIIAFHSTENVSGDGSSLSGATGGVCGHLASASGLDQASTGVPLQSESISPIGYCSVSKMSRP
jgi:hypothetical protein